MSTIQTARYEQFARRLLRLVGPSIMPRLQNDLSPVINIEDPADDGLLFWKGHRLASGRGTGVAAALEFGSVSLFNPLGSGKLVVVRAIGSSGGTGIFNFSFTQNRTALVQTTLAFADGRASLVSVPVAEIGFDSLVALPAGTWQQSANTGTTAGADMPPRFVLPPGVGLQVTKTVAAAATTISFEWLERSAESPELEG